MRYAAIALLGLSFAAVPAIVGCDREVGRETKVDVKDDGTVKKEQTTVTQHPDGSVTKSETETKSVPPR